MALLIYPPFDQAALITALRTDQAGQSSFSEFLAATWQAGVIRYDVDLVARTVTYYGSHDEAYVEAYPAVEIEYSADYSVSSQDENAG